ncbi:tRNA pseudouridine synthase B [Nannocystis exedens]|uniref:tRNA pseudouridine synthase B n=1 Tax=Nannocystis exedens TaxID=54 RepID=A0A1I1W699_9BACT|nr:tRNA pseudouridine(55) synthase TruB [Nannocystis exedens]PCC67479.1 putative TruB [Nannocystis exedens]SFD90652.1 tRNA pseudouridine synthase B [Nannocystis exedens]
MARATATERCGVLLVDKPEGPTSHDVVGFVRWVLNEQGVGHCGTLDPLASGLLVVCVGAATRLVPYLSAVDKVYRARFGLGRATTTADRAGETIAEAPVTPTQVRAAVNVLKDMCGALELPPPAYSAVKLEGRPAHALARRGEVLALPPRPMELRSVTEIEVGDDAIDATCAVSKGTYIRSLAEELGRRVGLPAHLAGLRRLACGGLDLAAAVPVLVSARLPDRAGAPPKFRLGLAEAGPREAMRARLEAALRPPGEVLPFPVRRVAGAESDALAGLLHGRVVGGDALPAVAPTLAEGHEAAARQALWFPDALVVVRLDGAEWRPEKVLHVAAPAAEADS